MYKWETYPNKIWKLYIYSLRESTINIVSDRKKLQKNKTAEHEKIK